MITSYLDAQSLLAEVATEQSVTPQYVEDLPILEAVGRISSINVASPASTPAFDTSAMDGYALSSHLTANASLDSPVLFCIRGTMAAGHVPKSVAHDATDLVPPCFEIMTGAQFPKPAPDHEFDACVKIENTKLVGGPCRRYSYIQVAQPVRRDQNRRFAGSDVRERDVILAKDQVVEPSHVMALASLGISRINVRRKPRIGVWCTGSELVPHDAEGQHPHRIRNSNGPYVIAALRANGADVDDLGIVQDDVDELIQVLRQRSDRKLYDILITTGGVCIGKFDMVPEGLRGVDATVRFHKVSIRPGAPILFATLASAIDGEPQQGGLTTTNGATSKRSPQIAIFGLPGNPMATAIGLRMFVTPYLRSVTGQQAENPIYATVTRGACLNKSMDILTDQLVGHERLNGAVCESPLLLTKNEHLDVFRHGHLTYTPGGVQVVMNEDQSSGKAKPWLAANCWVHVPCGIERVEEGSILPCFPLNPTC